MFYSIGSRLPCFYGALANSIKKNLLVSSPVAKFQVATLKATHGEKYPYSEPYPYREKPLNTFRAIFEKTKHRLNENSKIVCVEGNIGVGKTEFAKSLSRGFDLLYVEPTPEKSCFTNNDYKFDIRSLKEMLPESIRPYDLMDFYHDPHPEKGRVGRLCIQWYQEKFYTYCNALKHMLATGQGVVIPSSVYSDLVYIDALHKMGWLTPQFVKHYEDCRANSICELFRPHLTVYLDAPIDVVKKRIADRKDPREIGARNLTDKYLKAIEDAFKQKFLPFCRKYGEVIEIDWTNIGDETDMDAIIEEIQFLKLESEDIDDIKFKDWNRNNDDDYLRMRLFIEDEDSIDRVFNGPIPRECPEIVPKTEDVLAMRNILDAHPAIRCAVGWSTELGHKVAFKL